MTSKNHDPRCSGRAKSGKRCRAAATAGGLCFFHSNPSKASELGRIGGRSKRHAAAESPDPLPVLDSAIAVRDAVGRLIADVYAGKIPPRIAAGLAPLVTLQLRAIGTADLEQRVAKVEKLLAEGEEDLDGKKIEYLADDELTKVLRQAQQLQDEAMEASGSADSLETNKT
jgi:hypothetical protein